MKPAATVLAVFALQGLSVAASSNMAAGDSGWYGGVNVGKSHAKIDDARIAGSLSTAGFATTSIRADDRDTAYKLFGGYRFGAHVALEGGYLDLRKFGFTATTLPSGTLSGNMKVRGANLDLLGILPLAEGLAAFGRVGAMRAQTTDSFTATGLVRVLEPSAGTSATNYKIGLGLQYDLFRSLGVRAEAERYRIDDAVGNRGDVDLYSVGILYRFGRGASPSAAAAAGASPASVAVAVAAPAPVVAAPVVQAPVTTQATKYCSVLDIQFEINQTGIQREETERLAVIGTFMRRYPLTTAVIEGHTDNVGTPEQNLALSQRRAKSVVSYLVESLRIEPARLSAVGYGDTRPVADNGTEEGKRLNRRIDAVVACATDIEGLTVRPARITLALLIEFQPNSADIQPAYRGELQRVAEFLKANPAVTATVEGHTGNLQATAALALEMSQRRAQNVVNYLVENFGIARSRLGAQGFGQGRRFAYNDSLAGQQDNRRVNVIFNYPE